MRLIFDDKDSLALKSLQEGIVDFSDKRVNVKAVAMDTRLKANNKNNVDLLEVDLGELKSLQEG